jgi:hypothetical protein
MDRIRRILAVLTVLALAVLPLAQTQNIPWD